MSGYMIRLETADLENPVMLARLGRAAKLTDAEFAERYRAAATRLFETRADSPGACVEQT